MPAIVNRKNDDKNLAALSNKAGDNARGMFDDYENFDHFGSWSIYFQDENGNLIPFIIRQISQAENEEIVKKATKTKKVRGVPQEYVDGAEVSRRLVVAATVDPDFTSKEICDAYGVLDPLMVPGKMLLSGEYNRLLDEITSFSGFESLEDLETEAKN